MVGTNVAGPFSLERFVPLSFLRKVCILKAVMTDLFIMWLLDIMQNIYVKLVHLSHKTKLTRTLNEKSLKHKKKDMTFLQFERK